MDNYSFEGGTDENTPRTPTNFRTPKNSNNQERGRRTERKENKVAVWQQLDK